jgi:hypothetical protein
MALSTAYEAVASSIAVAAPAAAVQHSVIILSSARAAAAGCTVGALARVQEAAASSAIASALEEESTYQIPERRDLGSGDRSAARWLLALAFAAPAARAHCSLLAPLER